jgi:hypothetical protein
MYIKFSIIGIETSLLDKKIIVDFNKDLDPISVNKNTIELINRNLRQIVEANYEVVDDKIIITLVDEPIVNEEYSLNIKASITAITEEQLSAAISQTIIFESKIHNTVIITAPADHELVEDIYLVWTEEKENEAFEDINKYLIEIAEDNTFFNVKVHSVVTDRRNIKIFDNLQDGQYYARIRVQTGSDYGRWSEPITFVLRKKETEDDIIFEQDFEILNQSENGIAMDYFLFEFDTDIDVDLFDKDNITIIRRDI